MKDVQPLNRQVEVLVGPLSEWEGGGSEQLAVRMYGDGTPQNLRIKFTVPKHIISTASPTVISVYNLGPGIRSALQKSEIQVVLNAGWANVGLLNIFKGSLMASVSRREGPDIVTDMLCLAGFGATSRTVASKAFGSRYRLSDMLINIAKEFPNIVVDSNLIKVKEVAIGNQGQSFVGPASEFLDKLARVHGFSWWIENGAFYALDDEQAFVTGSVVISAENGFLLRAEPMLASPMQVRAGTTINSLFNPYVNPGELVQLETLINPVLNGPYKVHSMTHNGDTHTNEWTTNIESWVQVA